MTAFVLTCDHPSVIEWMKSAGIDPDKTYRVVIDMTVGEPVRVFIQQYATSETLNIETLPDLSQAVIIKTDGDK